MSIVNVMETGTAQTGRMPSSNIWADCPWEQIVLLREEGLAYWNDFMGVYTLAANQTATLLTEDIYGGVYGQTAGTAGTIATDLTDGGKGIAKLYLTTDNDTSSLMVLGGANVQSKCVLNTTHKTWFECRLKKTNITSDRVNVWVGFAEEALLSGTGILSALGANADKDMIAFHNPETALFGAWTNVVYNTAGGGGVTTHVTGSDDYPAWEADTYEKLGISCDGTTIKFWFNGVQYGDDLLLSATNVPNGEEMAIYIVTLADHADDMTVWVDWIRYAHQIL